MGRVRYGARTPEQLRNRELEATSIDVWALTLTAVYETDPDAVAAVLPPPLVPTGDPLVRMSVATVEIGHGRPPFGAGTFAVTGRHGDLEVGYPLVMPMTTEQAVVGGRETFGEPKKLARIELNRDGDRVEGFFERMGVRFAEITGTVVGEREVTPDRRRTDLYHKFLLDPAGTGFDAPPTLVHCHRDEKTRWAQRVEGDVVLRESMFDPVADLPVLKVRWIELAERSSVQRGEIVGTIDGDLIRPFVHQRYDDRSITGADD